MRLRHTIILAAVAGTVACSGSGISSGPPRYQHNAAVLNAKRVLFEYLRDNVSGYDVVDSTWRVVEEPDRLLIRVPLHSDSASFLLLPMPIDTSREQSTAINGWRVSRTFTAIHPFEMEVLSPDSVSSKPILTNETEIARQLADDLFVPSSGTMEVDLSVGRDGSVSSIQVERGYRDAVDRRVVASLATARFTPARVGTTNAEATVRFIVKLSGRNARQFGSTDGIAGVEFDMPEIQSPVDVATPPAVVGGLDALRRRIMFPSILLRAGIEGRAEVEFTVARDGTVDIVGTNESGNGLSGLLGQAVMQSSFTPAYTVAEEAVLSNVRMVATFRIIEPPIVPKSY